MTGAQAVSSIRKLTITTILFVIIDLAFPGEAPPAAGQGNVALSRDVYTFLYKSRTGKDQRRIEK
jgi:hypothetical protein